LRRRNLISGNADPGCAEMRPLSKRELKSVRMLLRRKGREGTGRYLVEGTRLCREALLWSHGVEMLIVSLPIRSDAVGSLIDICSGGGIPVGTVDERALKGFCDTVTPQGVAAVVRMEGWDRSVLSEPGDRVVVVLDRVSDPGNVGSILRSAEAAGASAVVTVSGSVELHNPKVVRASMGSIFRVPSFEGLSPVLICRELKQLGYRIIAVEASGGVPYTEADLSGRIALVLGNEAWGLSDEFLKSSDISISIPLKGNVESLNVSAAGAVILFKCAEVRSGEIGRF